jgi:DNA-binding MarR family transcriptional regulator
METRKTTPTIADSIRQGQPFASIQVEGLLTLVWAADRASCEADRPLRERDLSNAQYNVLRILRGSPAGLLVNEVVGRLVTRAPNITRLVDKLASKGLLTRERCHDDRRAVTLRITPEGKALVDELDEPMRDACAAAMRGLPPEDLARLNELLNRLRAPLEE